MIARPRGLEALADLRQRDEARAVAATVALRQSLDDARNSLAAAKEWLETATERLRASQNAEIHWATEGAAVGTMASALRGVAREMAVASRANARVAGAQRAVRVAEVALDAALATVARASAGRRVVEDRVQALREVVARSAEDALDDDADDLAARRATTR